MVVARELTRRVSSQREGLVPASFADRLATLCRGLDAATHAQELGRLRACRSLADLDALAREGWLTAETPGERLRLVRHGSGTFLVVAYTDGWTRTVCQA